VCRWATFIGLAMLLLSSPATGLFVKRLTGLRRRMLIETDSRVKLMNQLLVGIRVLKLYAWEAAQEAAVSEMTPTRHPHVHCQCLCCTDAAHCSTVVQALRFGIYMQVLEARQRELGRLRQAIPARVGMQVPAAPSKHCCCRRHVVRQ
jgi:ABC transporter transmembrane region